MSASSTGGIFSIAVDVCLLGLPTHTGGASLDVLAVLLVVKVGGAHISVLSGLEKAFGENNPPPHPPATCVHSLSVLAGLRAAREALEVLGQWATTGLWSLRIHPLSVQAPCTARSRGPWGLRLGEHRATGIGNASYTHDGADPCW